MTNNQSYGKTAIALHWVIALLIVITIPLAWVMMDLEDSPQGPLLFAWHKSIGFTIFLLAAARLIWRLIAGVPAAPANTPALANKVSGLIHFGLYVLLFAVPLSGWIMTSAAGLLWCIWAYGKCRISLPRAMPCMKLRKRCMKSWLMYCWV